MNMKRTCKHDERTMTDASGRIYNLLLTDRLVDKHLALRVDCNAEHAYKEPTGGGIVISLDIRNAPKYVLKMLINEMSDMLDNF